MTDLRTRLLRRIDRSGGLDACWLGSGAPTQDGYRQIGIGPRSAMRNWKLHRAAYAEFVGPIPDGMHVLHSCDNRPCCNWERHLFLGTEDDNHKDKATKGRAARGEGNGASKLSEAQVREIRLSVEPSSALGERYGVSKTTILDIRRGRTWRFLP